MALQAAPSRQLPVEFPEQVRISRKKLQVHDALKLCKVQSHSSGDLYCLMQSCIRKKDLVAARKLYAFITSDRPHLDSFVCGHLIHMFSACGSVMEASAVFERLHEPSVFAWSAIISANVRHGQHERALSYYKRMLRFEVQPDDHVLVAALKACTHSSHIIIGFLIHCHIFEGSLEAHAFISNSLFDMYFKSGFLEDAFNVFSRMQKRDMVAWNSLIAGLVHHGQCSKALKIVDNMKSDGVEPNTVTWNTILSGYAKSGDVDMVLKIFIEMQKTSQKPDAFTFASAFKACSKKRALTEGRWLHEQLIEACIDCDAHVCNSLVDMYIKCERMTDAHKQIQSLEICDVVTWTSLITGYAKLGHVNDAIKALKEMHQEKKDPDQVTFASLLKACTNSAALELGNLTHIYIVECGFECDVFVRIALVDLYATCASFRCAFNLFGGLLEKNIVAWGALIGGLALHGYYVSALECLHGMLYEGLDPNGIIFLSLLSACSQHCTAQEGESLLRSMTTTYGIIPKVEHYNMVADLLGRAGHLDKAKQILQSMSMQPNIEGWTSLLNSCLLCSSVLLGRECFNRVRATGKQDASIYISMLRIYLNEGMIEEAESIQGMLSKEILGKERRLACVESGNLMHDFNVKDVSHP